MMRKKTEERSLLPGWRLRTVGVGFVALLLLAGVGIVTNHARLEAQRREAYLPDLEKARRRTPDDGPLLAVLGGRLAQAGDYGRAMNALERAVAAGATDEPVWLVWAASVAAAGDPAGASEILRRGRTEGRGGALLRAALERCRGLGPSPSPGRMAAAICPGGPEIVLDTYAAGSFLSPLLERQGRRDPEHSGFATRERWAAEEPQNVAVQVLWAKALLRNRRTGEAASMLQRVLRASPDSAEAHLAYGDLLRRRGLWMQAGAEYNESLRLRPDWLPALLGLGQLALENRLGRLAVETFGKATKQAPDNPEAWIGLGRAYYVQRSQHDKSLEAFRNAARLAPHRTDFFSYYAEVLQNTHHFDEIEAVLRKRLSAEPTDVRSHYLLATTLLEIRPTPARIAEAERELRTAIRLQPDVPLPRLTLSHLLLDQDRPQEAIEHLKDILRREPNNGRAFTALARAYEAVGRRKDAEAAGAKALQIAAYVEQADRMEAAVLRNKDPEVHRRYARLQRNAGSEDKARRHLQMAAYLERSNGGADTSRESGLRSPDAGVAPPK